MRWIPRPWAVWTLLRKELLELLRDRRTLFLIYGLPVLAWPVLFGGGGSIAAWRVEKLKKDMGRIGWVEVAGPSAERLAREVFEAPGSELKRVALPAEEAAALKKLVSDPKTVSTELRTFLEKKNLAVAVVPKEDHGRIELQVFCDESRAVAFLSYLTLKRRIDQLGRIELEKRARQRGDPTPGAPFFVKLERLSKDDRDLARLAALMIPYLAVFLLTLAAFNPALQAMVEEKERGTLTTLLTTPIRASEIVTGKFLGVLFCCTSSATLHLLSAGFQLSQAASQVEGSPTLHGFGWLVGVAFSAAWVISAVTLFFASLARTNRDGQTLMSVVMLVVLLPAGLINLTDLQATVWSMGLPLANAALLVGASVADRLTPGLATQAMAANAFWAVLLLAVTTALFSRLQIERPGPGARN